jgi:hypothetical protein
MVVMFSGLENDRVAVTQWGFDRDHFLELEQSLFCRLRRLSGFLLVFG